MKKVLFIIIISFAIAILISFCNPLHSHAITSANVYLKSNKDIIEKEEEIEITFNINEQKTGAYSANIYFDDTKFEWISGPENVILEGNQIKILWYDEQGGIGAKQGELAKMVFKAKDDGLANFVINGEFFSEKGQLIETNFENLQIQIGREETNLEKQAKQEQGTNTQSNNANLHILRINIAGLVPDFETNVYEYDLAISSDINDIEVLAIAKNPKAQLEITGNKRFKRRDKFDKNKSHF